MTPRELECGLQFGVARRAKSRVLTEAFDVCAQEGAQRAEFLEDLPREVDSARAPTADADHKRQQLRHRECAGTQMQQLFARSFRARPVTNRHAELARPLERLQA